jgi:aldose 1-epimerase
MVKNKVNSGQGKNHLGTLHHFAHFKFLVLIITLFAFYNCSQQPGELFGTHPDGIKIYKYTLSNGNGMQAEIINYGATEVKLTAPDRDGNFQDVTFGYDDLNQYITGTAYFGAIVGRYGNRIDNGKFKINETEYQVTVNSGEHHLHGGTLGFNKVIWHVCEVTDKSIKLTYESKDGEEGYPGNVTLSVVYSLTDDNGLKIDFSGSTDAPTLLNPTNHGYFNLSGSFENTILNHKLFIDADKYTPVDDGLIPTGELADVADSPMDFRQATAIGARISDDNVQLKYGLGYDHNWVLNNFDGKVNTVATLSDSASGRVMEVLTDQPGLQFYSGNFLNGSDAGKGGVPYNYRTGLCLEAQYFPDSPNKENFATPLLQPGEEYKQTTIYRFSVMD